MASKKTGKLTFNFQSDREAVEVLKAIAFADMGDYIKAGPDGLMQLRPEALADPVKRLAIAHLELRENGGFSIQLHDKLAALRELKPYLQDEALGRVLAAGGFGDSK